MRYRKNFADITLRGCSTLGQFSGTEGETKPVGFLDSESQLLGSLHTMSPQMVESQPSASLQLLTLEPSSQTTGDIKVLKSSYKQGPS